MTPQAMVDAYLLDTPPDDPSFRIMVGPFTLKREDGSSREFFVYKWPATFEPPTDDEDDASSGAERSEVSDDAASSERSSTSSSASASTDSQFSYDEESADLSYVPPPDRTDHSVTPPPHEESADEISESPFSQAPLPEEGGLPQDEDELPWQPAVAQGPGRRPVTRWRVDAPVPMQRERPTQPSATAQLLALLSASTPSANTGAEAWALFDREGEADVQTGHVAGWNPAGRVPHGEATLDFFLRAWKSSGATRTGPMFLCEQIKWLLGQGADASGCDTLGNTPLFLAVNLSEAWLAMPAVSLLLEKGAIANLAATHRACSPLHVALILGRSQVAMELIRFGVAPLPSTTPLPPKGRLVQLAESPKCRDTVHAYMLRSAEVYFRANDIVALRSLSEHGMPLASDATLCTLVLHRNDEVCLAIQGGMPP